MGAGEGGRTAVKRKRFIARERSTHRHACGVAIILALSACASDDGATGLQSTLLQEADIVITTVDPDTATIDTTITVRITGSGFTEGSTATWIVDTTAATQIRTLSTSWKSENELEALIIISPEAELRSYSIRIRGKKGKQGIAVERFRVVAKPTALPEPGTVSEAIDINDSGVVVGYADDMSGAFVAMRWAQVDSAWSYTILGTGTAVAINNEGLILRRVYDRLSRTWRSWIHMPSGAEVDFGQVVVEDISNDGTIIGSISDAEQKSTSVVWRRVSPASWGPPQTLPIPAGFTGAWFGVISGAGHILGAISSSDSAFSVVWRYRDGQWLMPEPVELNLPGWASEINDATALAGSVLPCTPGLPNCYASPAFWPSPGGARKNLPTLYNTQAFVNGMNNANQVVGSALVHYNDPSGGGPLAALVWHAVIWFPSSQWPEDLGAIRPSHAGEAVAINNRGWVAGSMSNNSYSLQRHATVWKLPATPTISFRLASSRH